MPWPALDHNLLSGDAQSPVRPLAFRREHRQMREHGLLVNHTIQISLSRTLLLFEDWTHAFPHSLCPFCYVPLNIEQKLVGKKVPTNSYSKFGVPSEWWWNCLCYKSLLFSLTPAKPGTLSCRKAKKKSVLNIKCLLLKSVPFNFPWSKCSYLTNLKVISVNA